MISNHLQEIRNLSDTALAFWNPPQSVDLHIRDAELKLGAADHGVRLEVPYLVDIAVLGRTDPLALGFVLAFLITTFTCIILLRQDGRHTPSEPVELFTRPKHPRHVRFEILRIFFTEDLDAEAAAPSSAIGVVQVFRHLEDPATTLFMPPNRRGCLRRR